MALTPHRQPPAVSSNHLRGRGRSDQPDAASAYRSIADALLPELDAISGQLSLTTGSAQTYLREFRAHSYELCHAAAQFEEIVFRKAIAAPGHDALGSAND